MGLSASRVKIGDLQEGDHVCSYPNGYGHLISHHGIVTCKYGTGSVIHFDKPGSDHDYEKCNSCKTRGDELRREDKVKGIDNRSVWLSCPTCFSHGKPLFLCKYDCGFSDFMFRDWATRSASTSALPAEVVARAHGYYNNNNFGKYIWAHRNCESFARMCKINKMGSKQVALIPAYAIALGILS
jgi:hypothetical protein